MHDMELQLRLSFPTHSPIRGLDLNNNGFEPKEMVGLEPWSRAGSCWDNKRSFEDAFGKIKDASPSQTVPLLIWSGQPNDNNDDDHRRAKKRISFGINKNDEEKTPHLVGWPPIKSWRKKLLHQRQGGHVLNNQAAATKENDGSNSMYIKVKMEGVAIARKIDLRLYHSYQGLTTSLISMFATCQKREKDGSGFTVAYQDKDGDWLLAGDVPWRTFIESVRRLEILRNGG